MRNHTKKPIVAKNTAANKIQQLTNKATRLKSLFFLIDSNRETIATNLSIEQARPISSRINGSIIKFQRMGGVS